MRRLTVIALSAALAALPLAAGAQIQTGEQLVKSCTAAKTAPTYQADALSCVAYLAGATGAILRLQEVQANELKLPRQVCLPPGASAAVVREGVVKSVSARPDLMKADSATAALVALINAFPCPKS